MSATLSVSIVAPYGEIFSGDVDSITMPGVDGEFGVLHGHSNMLSLLKAGVIEIAQGQSRELVAIDWGYAEVMSSKVDVIVNGAVAINGASESVISNAIASAKELLESASNDKVAFYSIVSKIEHVAKSRLQ